MGTFITVDSGRDTGYVQVSFACQDHEDCTVIMTVDDAEQGSEAHLPAEAVRALCVLLQPPKQP